ncbi:hypothetical protein POPTR_017G047000v4 [Populus trichocarpa]|uniref:Uncharacterized protein n=1 Tax=Populus trichocarpa TaxID=3694 RepID=A0ACC0RPK2_POPTR|nr:hypothetical protein POPTR_017G047000v4 [Populus trichocarpa]
MASFSCFILALFIALSISGGEAARQLLQLPPLPSVPNFPKPTLPPMPSIPTLPQPTLPTAQPSLPKPTLPPLPSLPTMPSLPKVTLPPLPSMPSMPTIPIPTAIPSIPFSEYKCQNLMYAKTLQQIPTKFKIILCKPCKTIIITNQFSLLPCMPKCPSIKGFFNSFLFPGLAIILYCVFNWA